MTPEDAERNDAMTTLLAIARMKKLEDLVNERNMLGHELREPNAAQMPDWAAKVARMDAVRYEIKKLTNRDA
jgi:hypothetical protein